MGITRGFSIRQNFSLARSQCLRAEISQRMGWRHSDLTGVGLTSAQSAGISLKTAGLYLPLVSFGFLLTSEAKSSPLICPYAMRQNAQAGRSTWNFVGGIATLGVLSLGVSLGLDTWLSGDAAPSHLTKLILGTLGMMGVGGLAWHMVLQGNDILEKNGKLSALNNQLLAVQSQATSAQSLRDVYFSRLVDSPDDILIGLISNLPGPVLEMETPENIARVIRRFPIQVADLLIQNVLEKNTAERQKTHTPLSRAITHMPEADRIVLAEEILTRPDLPSRWDWWDGFAHSQSLLYRGILSRGITERTLGLSARSADSDLGMAAAHLVTSDQMDIVSILLAHHNPLVRHAVLAKALTSDSSEDSLREMFKSPHADVRAAVAGHPGIPHDLIEKALEDSAPEVRRIASQILLTFESASLVIAQALNSPHADIRARAVEITAESEVGVFRKFLNDPTAEVRCAAFKKMMASWNSTSLNELATSTTHEDLLWLVAEHEDCPKDTVAASLGKIVPRVIHHPAHTVTHSTTERYTYVETTWVETVPEWTEIQYPGQNLERAARLLRKRGIPFSFDLVNQLQPPLSDKLRAAIHTSIVAELIPALTGPNHEDASPDRLLEIVSFLETIDLKEAAAMLLKASPRRVGELFALMTVEQTSKMIGALPAEFVTKILREKR